MLSVRDTCVLAGLALFAAAVPASAQVTDQKVLTLWGARTVADAAAAEARKHNAGGAIAVVDTGGSLLFLQRLDNTFPAAAAVAIEKARTAATFRRPTRDFENAIKNGRTSLLGVAVMTPLQGGVPIVVDGQVLGAIGVSGASSAQEDDEIATAASTVLGGATPTPAGTR
jgi:glc operon protein GlcG